MTLAKVPYGAEISNTIYAVFQTWIIETQAPDLAKQMEKGEECCSCVGFLTVAGKSLAVAPAHLLTAVIVCPALFIYDLVMSVFFFLANLCTAFTFDFLRERFATHLHSAVQLPLQCVRHFFTALCPPAAYRAEGVLLQRQIINPGLIKIEGLNEKRQVPRGLTGYAFQEEIDKTRSPEGVRKLERNYNDALGSPVNFLSADFARNIAPFVYKA